MQTGEISQASKSIVEEGESQNRSKVGLAEVQHIIDMNQQLVQKTDTKVSIFLAIAAIIISVTAGWNFDEYDAISGIIMILAIISALLSVLILISSIFPKPSPSDTVIFFTGILKYSKKEYLSKMAEISNEELCNDYSDSIYELARIQKRRHSYMRIGLVFLIIGLLLIALSFIVRLIL